VIKSTYISNILDLLLDGDEIGMHLRKQKDFLTEAGYRYTPYGLFVSFSHDKAIENYKAHKHDLILDGVIIRANTIGHGTEAILHFKGGLADYLEIWSPVDNYPNTEPSQYSLKQEWTGSPGREIVVE
jgi:hypothetical protein